MRKLIGGMVFGAMLWSVPAVAEAQRRAAATGARHEFGVDVGVAYVKPDGVDGGIAIGTPLDVRVGLVSAGTMMWEPRLSLNFSTVGGETTYLFVPGVNVLFSNSPGRHRNGMYFTGGAGLVLADFGFGSGTAVQLNGGVGWRKPSGSAAWRYEVGFRYTGESDISVSTVEVGARLGVSFWR